MTALEWRRVLRTDPVMVDLVERHGERDVAPAPDEFRRLVATVIDQQPSTASASSITSGR